MGTWRGTHPKLGNVVGLCTCELIAPDWIITAGHCATRVLKHEKVDVKIKFHGTKVERSVTKCIHADGDQDVAICHLTAAVHAFPSVKVNPEIYKTSHHAKQDVFTIGTKDGLHVVGPKKLEYEGNGAHLYVKKVCSSEMKLGTVYISKSLPKNTHI